MGRDTPLAGYAEGNRWVGPFSHTKFDKITSHILAFYLLQTNFALITCLAQTICKHLYREPLNLAPRLPFHCLSLSLGEKPWLQLVMWPPRIWVVKKSVGLEGWQSILIVAVANFMGFKTLATLLFDHRPNWTTQSPITN